MSGFNPGMGGSEPSAMQDTSENNALVALNPQAGDFEPSAWRRGSSDIWLAREFAQGRQANSAPANFPLPAGYQESDFRGRNVHGDRYRIISLKGGTNRSTRVYVITPLNRDKHYALKAIDDYDRGSRRRWTEQQQLNRVKNEVRMHIKVNEHRNICTLHEAFQFLPVGHLVMDLCKLSLYQLIASPRGKPATPFNAKKLFLDIVDGTMHCHSKNVAHRNLNPHNVGILFNVESLEDDAVLLDFGEAISPMENKDITFLIFHCYIAPEIHQMQTQTYKWDAGDIWSLGVILFFMCTARKPFQDNLLSEGHYQDYSKRGRPLRSRFPKISDELEEILRFVFVDNDKSRLPLGQLRMLVLNCMNFFSANYPDLTGSPSSRDLTLLNHQRPDQRDDVHDEFIKIQVTGPLLLPAPPPQPSGDTGPNLPETAEATTSNTETGQTMLVPYIQASEARITQSQIVNSETTSDHIMSSQPPVAPTSGSLVPSSMNSSHQYVHPGTMSRWNYSQPFPPPPPWTSWNYGQIGTPASTWISFLTPAMPAYNFPSRYPLNRFNATQYNFGHIMSGQANPPSNTVNFSGYTGTIPPRNFRQAQQRPRLLPAIPMQAPNAIVQIASTSANPGHGVPSGNLTAQSPRPQSLPARPNVLAPSASGTSKSHKRRLPSRDSSSQSNLSPSMASSSSPSGPSGPTGTSTPP